MQKITLNVTKVVCFNDDSDQIWRCRHQLRIPLLGKVVLDFLLLRNGLRGASIELCGHLDDRKASGWLFLALIKGGGTTAEGNY